MLLAVNSGVTDAFAFVALGGTFTSVMTGNMVIFGLALARTSLVLATHALAAIAAFVIGSAVGARVAGLAGSGEPTWPGGVTRALRLQLAVTVLAAVLFELAPRDVTGWQVLILVLNAMALGLQSSAVLKFGVPGLSTTYLTGTLATMAVRLAHGHGVVAVRHNLLLLAGLIGGAALGGVLALHATRWTPALSVVLLLTVLVVRRRRRLTDA